MGAPVRSRVALLSVRATAAPAKPAASGSSKVDTSLTPKQLGFTMPGEHVACVLCCMLVHRHC